MFNKDIKTPRSGQTPFEFYVQEMTLQEQPEEQMDLCTKRFTAVPSRTVRNR